MNVPASALPTCAAAATTTDADQPCVDLLACGAQTALRLRRYAKSPIDRYRRLKTQEPIHPIHIEPLTHNIQRNP